MIKQFPNTIHLLQPEWNSFINKKYSLAERFLNDEGMITINKIVKEVRMSTQIHKILGIE